MSASIFNNKTQPPVLADLERVPGGAYGWFEQIAKHIGRGGTIIYEWKYQDRSRARTDKVSLGKRILSILKSCQKKTLNHGN